MREKEKAKEDSKEKEEHTQVKNKHRILSGSQNKMVLGGPKKKKRGKNCLSEKWSSHLPTRKECRQ